MAIDRTGINSLEGTSFKTGAPNLRLTGDVQMAKALPINLQNLILQYWKASPGGDASPTDRIEDVPESFIKEMLEVLGKQASAEQLEFKFPLIDPNNPTQEYYDYRNRELGLGRSPEPPEWYNKEIEMAYGGTARPTYTQSRKQRMAQGGIARLGYRGGKIIEGHPHNLAYITPGEAKTLQNLGGKKVMTPEGIPAYPPWDDPGASRNFTYRS